MSAKTEPDTAEESDAKRRRDQIAQAAVDAAVINLFPVDARDDDTARGSGDDPSAMRCG